MGRLLLGIALAAFLLVPFGASAQQAPTPPSQPMADGANTGKLVAIGVGVIGGVAVAEALGVVDVVTLLGGVAGGYLAAWWYDSANNDSTRMRMSGRQATAALATWHPERLALAQ